MTMARCPSEPPPVYGALHHYPAIPTDLRVVCLWSALGLTLTGLFFAMGFGVEITRALGAG
jgi:hypothetical protein